MSGDGLPRRPRDAAPPALSDAAQVLALVAAASRSTPCATCDGTGRGERHTILLTRDCPACDGTADASTVPRQMLSRYHATALATLAAACGGAR